MDAYKKKIFLKKGESRGKKYREKRRARKRERRTWERDNSNARDRAAVGKKKKRKQFHSWVSFIFPPLRHTSVSLSLSLDMTLCCWLFFYSLCLASRRREPLADKLTNSDNAARVSRVRCHSISSRTVRTHTWEIVHRKCKRVAEKFGQHPLILARRRHHSVTPVRVCPCCKVAFHFHRTVLFPNSTGTTNQRERVAVPSEIGAVSGSSLETFCIVSRRFLPPSSSDKPWPPQVEGKVSWNPIVLVTKFLLRSSSFAVWCRKNRAVVR